MEYPYFSSQVVISTNQDGSPTQNNVESAAVVEKDKSELKQFKEGIMSEVKGMLASFLDDRLSITAPSVTLSRDAGNLPGGSPSEKRARIDVGDSYSDLIPVHKKQNLDSAKLDVCEEFLAKLDEEMPDSIEYGKEIPDKLASRIVGHFVHKSADARKIINESTECILHY